MPEPDVALIKTLSSKLNLNLSIFVHNWNQRKRQLSDIRSQETQILFRYFLQQELIIQAEGAAG